MTLLCAAATYVHVLAPGATRIAEQLTRIRHMALQLPARTLAHQARAEQSSGFAAYAYLSAEARKYTPILISVHGTRENTNQRPGRRQHQHQQFISFFPVSYSTSEFQDAGQRPIKGGRPCRLKGRLNLRSKSLLPTRTLRKARQVRRLHAARDAGIRHPLFTRARSQAAQIHGIRRGPSRPSLPTEERNDTVILRLVLSHSHFLHLKRLQKRSVEGLVRNLSALCFPPLSASLRSAHNLAESMLCPDPPLFQFPLKKRTPAHSPPAEMLSPLF